MELAVVAFAHYINKNFNSFMRSYGSVEAARQKCLSAHLNCPNHGKKCYYKAAMTLLNRSEEILRKNNLVSGDLKAALKFAQAITVCNRQMNVACAKIPPDLKWLIPRYIELQKERFSEENSDSDSDDEDDLIDAISEPEPNPEPESVQDLWQADLMLQALLERANHGLLTADTLSETADSNFPRLLFVKKFSDLFDAKDANDVDEEQPQKRKDILDYLKTYSTPIALPKPTMYSDLDRVITDVETYVDKFENIMSCDVVGGFLVINYNHSISFNVCKVEGETMVTICDPDFGCFSRYETFDADPTMTNYFQDYKNAAMFGIAQITEISTLCLIRDQESLEIAILARKNREED